MLPVRAVTCVPIWIKELSWRAAEAHSAGIAATSVGAPLHAQDAAGEALSDRSVVW